MNIKDTIDTVNGQDELYEKFAEHSAKWMQRDFEVVANLFITSEDIDRPKVMALARLFATIDIDKKGLKQFKKMSGVPEKFAKEHYYLTSALGVLEVLGETNETTN